MRRYPLAILLFLLCFIVLTTSAFPQSFKKTRAEAVRGDSRAQYELGVMYAEGRGVKQNYAQAKVWWEKAAAKGHTGGQYNLGVMYAEGKGVTQDLARAQAWWEKAANTGRPSGPIRTRGLVSRGQGGQARLYPGPNLV